MSAPHNVNLDKERRRHRGPLIGMLLVVLFAIGLLIYWLGDEFSMGNAPGTAAENPDAASSVGTADEGSVPTEVDPLTNDEAAVPTSPAPTTTTPPPAAPAD